MMKKAFALLLLAAVMLVSCGKKGDPYPKDSLHDLQQKNKQAQSPAQGQAK